MGRAIDMEKNITVLTQKVEKLENTVRGMVSKLDTLNEKSSKTKHVDLVEDVGALDAEELGSTITGGAKAYKMEKVNEKEKANNKGSRKGSKSGNGRSGKSSKKNI